MSGLSLFAVAPVTAVTYRQWQFGKFVWLRSFFYSETPAAGALTRTEGLIEATAYTTTEAVGAAGTAATTTTASATPTSTITTLLEIAGSVPVETPSKKKKKKKKKKKRAHGSKGKSHRDQASHNQREAFAKQHSMDSARNRR